MRGVKISEIFHPISLFIWEGDLKILDWESTKQILSNVIKLDV